MLPTREIGRPARKENPILGLRECHETFEVGPENPLFKGHVVYGRHLMPGVGYVDLILQLLVWQQVPLSQIELRNLSIFTPLVVGKGERVQMTVAGRPVPTGELRIEVRTRRQNNDKEVLHAVAKVTFVEPVRFEQTLSLPISGANTRTNFDEIYRWCREHKLVHSGLMKVDGLVHHRSDDWIAELELAAGHHATAGAFAFHPALFEGGLLGGGIALSMLHADSDGSRLFLPLAFESFRASRSLGKRCYVRVPARSISRDDELIRLMVEFYDEQGHKVAEIGRFVAKRVPEVSALDAGTDRVEIVPARPSQPADDRAADSPIGRNKELTSLLRELVGARTGCSAEHVSIHAGYYELGLASADLLSLVSDLENTLSLSLPPTLLFEHRTISELAAWLETQNASAGVTSTRGPGLDDRRRETDPALGLSSNRPIPESGADLRHRQLRTVLIDEIAALLRIPAEEVDPTREFAEFGLDWTACAQLANRLNNRYELSLTSTLFSEHRSVDALVAFVAGTDMIAAARYPSSRGTAMADTRNSSFVHVPEIKESRPLLHLLSETGDKLVFEVTLDGSEPFLRDHRVRGDLILPGVVHLELAQQAVRHALGNPDPARIQLDDIVWARPAVCGTEGLSMCVSVRRQDRDTADFTIERIQEDASQILCSRGRARLCDSETHRLELKALRAMIDAAVYDRSWFYDFYARAGLDYGPAQRPVQEIRIGRDSQNRPQVLAELCAPREAGYFDVMRLHPSIADGAFQATLGLWLAQAGAESGSARVALPFNLQYLRTLRPTPEHAWAWVRHRSDSDVTSGSARLDITIVDERGDVCVEFGGLGTRVLPGEAGVGRENLPHREMTSSPVSPLCTARSIPSSRRDPGTDAANIDIAIIGVSGRYPEAADLEAFWQNLRNGRDCIREIPRERWDYQRFAQGDRPGAARWGGFLDAIDRFDPLFFHISMLEADYLDPQERIFLECAHHVLEDAGYTGKSLARVLNNHAGGARGCEVGVFVGVMYQEYQLFGAQAQAHGQAIALSGSASTVANRVSYFYDFHGPSMAIDTMCSSSLTAIHLACESIRSGQCGAAIAGGVNLSPHPNKYLMLGQRHFLASDGRCRSFGEGGDGYVPSEGVGAVLLKSLHAAVADGDHIYGVIKGTALNHGGRTTGYSVPSPTAQGEVIANALKAAGVDPRSLSYLEAHGTGTSLGDPIEIDGLMKAFRQAGGLPECCAIGSVKSNIGHGESAAGIAGVTKVLLQMQHGELVPSLHSSRLNPHIKFDRTPVRVQQRAEPWHRPIIDLDGVRHTLPRIAGVSGFGAGGSNAHVVLAEYIPEPENARNPAGSSAPALLVLSAMSEEQIVQQVIRLRARLAHLEDGELHSVAWTLQTGRLELEERLAFAASSIQDARAILDAYAADLGRPGRWFRGTVRPGQEPAPEQLADALSAWREEARYEKLLALWTQGAEVDWDAVRPASVHPRRLSLPGYPFARERCWIDVEVPEGASSNSLPHTSATQTKGPSPEHDLVLLTPVWRAADTASGGSTTSARGVSHAERHVLIARLPGAAQAASLETALGSDVHCEIIELVDGLLTTQYEQLALRVHERIRALLERGVRQRTLLQVALTGDAGNDDLQRLGCLGGVAGLLKTAHQENPLLFTQYVECLDAPTPGLVASRLAQEARPERPVDVRYRSGQRWTMSLEPLPDGRQAAPFRHGGVYLITGGAGALGLIVARDIARSTGGATVVLVGRSALREDQQRELEALGSAGLTVEYRRADVADRKAVAALLTDVTRMHGPLTGIVHSAGLIRDKLLIRKSTEDFQQVFAPKVAGLVHLDELSREQPLELFLCFSSTGGTFGNAGQGDYAAANAFMDAYAVYRNQLVTGGLRSGRTVSLAWPLWDEGGMGLDGAVRHKLERLGLAPLDTPRGLQAMRLVVGASQEGRDVGRVVVLVGDRARLLSELMGQEARNLDGRNESANVAPERVQPAPLTQEHELPQPTPSKGLEDRAIAQLRRVLAASLKLAPGRIDPDVPLERYGMDSVIAVDLVSKLESAFGPLSSTLLLEVQTVRALARHFLDKHPSQLRAWTGADQEAEAHTAETRKESEPRAMTNLQESEQIAAVRAVTTSARSESSQRQTHRSEDIAIIGIAGRYPQAGDLETFWANLRAGKDCVTTLPAERWASEGFEPDEGAPAWGAFLEGIDLFDPLFFGISPGEAAAMDPQQRLFLETVWLLLEQSGITQQVLEKHYGRRVGVYVGSQYQMYRTDDVDAGLAALTSAASYNLIANRVSHFFGLEGPSLAVDSMCTSSTMAIHMACTDLLRGEAELAVAGGVNLTVHPEKYRALSEMQLLGSSPDSRSFLGGDGYLPAEAVGAVLLKPLEAALRDGDLIHAVIKSTASMHGGRANGFMTPSHQTRVNVMRRALERAGVEPSSIGYVEASADGSALSDNIELSALREVFQGTTESVTLGTVKSNLGHPEAASGIAQVTKVVLQLEHRELPPLLKADHANETHNLSGTSLRFCDKSSPWQPRSPSDTNGRPVPLRALINSVAAGGSHVSLVIEAPPPAQPAGEAPRDHASQLVLLSARTSSRLRTAAQRLHDYLKKECSESLADIAYTTQLGREALKERLAVVARSREELIESLAHYLANDHEQSNADPLINACSIYAGSVDRDSGPLATILSGPRGDQMIAGLVADQDLDRLAELWVVGTNVPWHELHHGRRRLVPLPPTVFERRRCWIGQSARRLVDEQTVAVDRDTGVSRSLSAPAQSPPEISRSISEQAMVEAWSQLLQISPNELEPTSDFFALGGNSLLAARLVNLLKQQLGVELSAKTVFQSPRLSELAAVVARHTDVKSKGESVAIERILEGISLIEKMSDAELDALELQR